MVGWYRLVRVVDANIVQFAINALRFVRRSHRVVINELVHCVFECIHAHTSTCSRRTKKHGRQCVEVFRFSCKCE